MMANLELTVREMLNAPPNKIFKIVLSGGKIQLGRVLQAGDYPTRLNAAWFRIHNDIEEYENLQHQNVQPSEIKIHDGEFLIIQMIDINRSNGISNFERIATLNEEIQAFETHYRDYGIIIKNLPDKIAELKEAVQAFAKEHPSLNADTPIEILDSQIKECRQCPPSFGITIEDDKQYKMRTIADAKNYSDRAVKILLKRFLDKINSFICFQKNIY